MTKMIQIFADDHSNLYLNEIYKSFLSRNLSLNSKDITTTKNMESRLIQGSSVEFLSLDHGLDLLVIWSEVQSQRVSAKPTRIATSAKCTGNHDLLFLV